MENQTPKKRGRKPGTVVERNKYQLAGAAAARLSKLESRRQEFYQKVDERLVTTRKSILHDCTPEVLDMLVNSGDVTHEEVSALADFIPPAKRGPKAATSAAAE